MLFSFPFPQDPSCPDIRKRLKALLFLDIDGVLHPCKAGAVLMCHLPLLAGWLAENPSVGVVCASSWRSEGPKFLASELRMISDRLLGWTATDQENPAVAAGEFNPELGGRATLCRLWMDQNGWADAPALALDDMDDLYPDGCGLTVIAPNPDVGLTADHLARLTRFFGS